MSIEQPKLREVARTELQQALDRCLRIFPLTQSCLSCMNFDEKKELCNKYQQKPPARIIAYACSSYEDCDDIPF